MVNPTWSFSPGGAVWRVHPAVAGHVVGEERDLTQRRVTFFALDFPSGKVIWKGLGVEEQWWTGIERIEGEFLFIHGFVSPDLPVHRGITVVDISHGKILWSNPAWILESVTGERLTVLGDQRSGQGVLAVDPRTGEIITADAETAASRPEEPPWWKSVAFPDGATVTKLAAYPSARSAISQREADTVVGDVELLDRPPLLIVAATLRRKTFRGESLEQVLRVVHQGSGKVVHEVTLARDAKGPVMESFFLQEGMLVYVKESKTLCGVRMMDK
jgi:hypothetical protein